MIEVRPSPHSLTMWGDCQRCPLRDAHQTVFGWGAPDAKLTIIGEAPGANEVKLGRPFTGPSGKLIREVLKQAGLDPEYDVHWTNSVLCRDGKNDSPPIDAIRACADRLHENELVYTKPKKILTLGAYGLASLLRLSRVPSISRWRGLGISVDMGTYNAFAVPTYHPAAILRESDLFRDMCRDVEKVMTQDAPFPDLDIELVVPHTREEALEWCETLRQATAISCDLETTGLNYMHDLIISIGFGARYVDGRYVSVILGSWVYRDPQVKAAMRAIFDGPTVIFHNSKFDLHFLDAYFNEELRPRHVADTMLMNYTIDERPMGRFSTHSLKTLARLRYDVANYTFDFKAFYAGKTEVMDLFTYQGRDCAYTLRLYHDLLAEMEDDGKRLHDKTLIPAMHALRHVERTGVLVDMDHLEAVRANAVRTLNEMRDDIIGWADRQEDFNPASSQQVSKLLEDMGVDMDLTFIAAAVHMLQMKKDKGKEFSKDMHIRHWTPTSRDALFKIGLHYGDPIRQIAQMIISYRAIKASLGTFVDGIQKRTDHDGRLRTSFLLHGTSTGRLSSQDPNLQNLPNYGSGGSGGSGVSQVFERFNIENFSTAIRNCLVPSPGFTFVEADFGQLELRVAAYYADDQPLKDVFIRGEDIHTRVASEIYGLPPEQITGEQRRRGKVIDFGIVYGRTPMQIVEGQEMDSVQAKGGERWTLKQAEAFQQKFLEGFPKLGSWLREQRKRVHKDHGTMVTATGRVRRTPLVLSDGHAERVGVNFPIQSLASDLCLHALIRLVDTLDPADARVLITIHDSILLEVREDILADMVAYVKATMEGQTLVTTDIPFEVDVKVGPRFGELKKCPKP